jgi:hypothetical protein
MFNIGDKVSWQVRNKHRSNPRFQPSFLMFRGEIVATGPRLVAKYLYSRTDGTVLTHTQEFKELRNGKYIPKNEDKDDPKGRLYLEALE